MKKHRKFFLPPPKDGSDFKELFKRLAAAGAGRPVDKDGFPEGPWTPELLAEAISQLDPDGAGVDLRTVQLWFQDNDKGISSNNIRWLARIFGCDDPAATSEWQTELSAAQSRLTAKRREQKRAGSRNPLRETGAAPPPTVIDETGLPIKKPRDTVASRSSRDFSLASRMEALFSRRSSLDLPVLVFAGAVTLGFLAYIVNVHSVTYDPAHGPPKQVGFLWAPNWTVLFLALLPLYLKFAGELLVFWKDEGRAKVENRVEVDSSDGWTRNVEAFSYSYWANLTICLLVVSVLQWINECLVPLIMNDPGNFGVDWGRIAIIRPEIISASEAIAFTAVAYLYMGICFFLFFTGLILLYTMAHDVRTINKAPDHCPRLGDPSRTREIGFSMMCGIFRCTVLGLLIAICMKLQNMFMLSSAETIVTWFYGDLLSVVNGREMDTERFGYSRPTLYSSLLVVIATSAVFLYGSNSIHRMLVQSPKLDAAQSTTGEWQIVVPWRIMAGVVVLLVANYLLIDVFSGFSIFLSIGVLIGIYSLVDPGFTRWRVS